MKIEYWYDHHTRCWVVLVFDAAEVEIESEYCPNREWLEIALRDFQEKYNIVEVKKV